MISPLAGPSRRTLLNGGALAGVVLLLLLLLAWHPWSSGAKAAIVVPVVVPLSGEQADKGHEVANAVDLYFRQVNQSGGIDGHKLRVQPVDDALDANVARQRAQAIVASDALAVVGHLNSVTSTAAGPIYRDGHLLAVTGAATADGVTDGNPYYFRTIFTNSDEGAALAAYAHDVLHFSRATVVESDEAFGTSLTSAFVAAFTHAGGTVAPTLNYAIEPDKTTASVQATTAALAADPDPGIVLLAITSDTGARDVMVAARRAGISPHFLGADSTGGDTFPQRFQAEPEEQTQPGYFTEGMYAGSPIIFDSANNTAQAFAQAYKQAFGHDPGWEEAKFYDAAHVIVEALIKAHPRFDHNDRDSDRQSVRNALASFNSPQATIDTTTGPIFFNSHNSVAQPVRLGQYLHGGFISAPDQLEAVTNLGEVNIPAELAAGTIVQLGDQYAWKQRVVYTGIDVNQISHIDQSKGTFTADFYLWFRYSGDDDVLNAEILNAADKSFDPKSPLTADDVNGLHHKLYRVRGDFKAEYDFHDYPFDRQVLTIEIQNQHLPRSRVIYAIDAGSHGASTAGAGTNPVRSLTSWTLKAQQQFQDTAKTTSTRGYDTASTSDASTEYSTRYIALTVQRRSTVFLAKTLLPLMLLTLGVFCTLFFPFSLIKERLTIAISAMLAAAVLLTSINNGLDAGYTISVEYVFYLFFGLCLFSIVVALALERLVEAKQHSVARRLVWSSQLLYVLTIVSLVAIYALRFSNRFV